MAKGIKVVTEDAFEKIMDKVYYADGIEDIISLDPAGNPIYKLSNTNDLDLKVWVKLRCMPDRNGKREEGPAISLRPAEFVALVHLFGAKDFTPTKQTRTLSPVLLEGVSKANEAAEAIAVESKNGWASVYDIPALHPPEGKYGVQFSGAFSPQFPGSYDFTSGGNDSHYIILKFLIVTDGNGDETMWEGFEISVFLNNAFVDYHEHNGEISNAMELGHPLIVPGKNGDRWQEFGRYFAPGIWEEYDWQTNPNNSRWDVCEVKKPQYVLFNRALEKERTVYVWYEKTERTDKFWFDLLALKQHNSSPQTKQVWTGADFVTFVTARKWHYAEGDMPELFVSTDPVLFTSEGETWANMYLAGEAGPLKVAGINLDETPFAALSSEQFEKLMNEMRNRYA
jgi:hypothetical protein